MPTTTHDVIVIGGGAAGLTASGMAATFGARTLMIERARLGGDCTWYGCVPSKTLLKSAKVAHHIRAAGQYGLTDQPIQLDFARMMTHLRTIREDVYEEADKPEIFEDMGVEIRTGSARFVDDHTLEIEGPQGIDRVSGRYIVIAAGAGAFVPPIKGLDAVPYLTNETLFEIDTLPKRLAIIGGGPIGTEMSQAFTRFGAKVTVIDMNDRILRKDDPELVAMLQAKLETEGVQYCFDAGVKSVTKEGAEIAVEMEIGGAPRVLKADALLVATGRRPNLSGLNLEAAGVAYTKRGVTVDDRCRTNRKHIYAIGDITGRYQFTHMSEHMAKVAMTNALLKVPMKIDKKHVPWATYTDPELAHVGATDGELDARGTSYETYRFPYTKVDRAITDGETTGLIKVYGKGWNGKILGASVLGTAAGEMIGEFALAMRNGVTLRQISDTIHPYPTYGLGVRRAADQWYVRRQSPRLLRLLQKVFGYRGTVVTFAPDQVV